MMAERVPKEQLIARNVVTERRGGEQILGGHFPGRTRADEAVAGGIRS